MSHDCPGPQHADPQRAKYLHQRIPAADHSLHTCTRPKATRQAKCTPGMNDSSAEPVVAVTAAEPCCRATVPKESDLNRCAQSLHLQVLKNTLQKVAVQNKRTGVVSHYAIRTSLHWTTTTASTSHCKRRCAGQQNSSIVANDRGGGLLPPSQDQAP